MALTIIRSRHRRSFFFLFIFCLDLCWNSLVLCLTMGILLSIGSSKLYVLLSLLLLNFTFYADLMKWIKGRIHRIKPLGRGDAASSLSLCYGHMFITLNVMWVWKHRNSWTVKVTGSSFVLLLWFQISAAFTSSRAIKKAVKSCDLVFFRMLRLQ